MDVLIRLTLILFALHKSPVGILKMQVMEDLVLHAIVFSGYDLAVAWEGPGIREQRLG